MRQIGSMNEPGRTSPRWLGLWREASDTLAPDLLVTAGMVVVILVGTGLLKPVVLASSGTTFWLGSFLYRRRSPSAAGS